MLLLSNLLGEEHSAECLGCIVIRGNFPACVPLHAAFPLDCQSWGLTSVTPAVSLHGEVQRRVSGGVILHPTLGHVQGSRDGGGAVTQRDLRYLNFVNHLSTRRNVIIWIQRLPPRLLPLYGEAGGDVEDTDRVLTATVNNFVFLS